MLETITAGLLLATVSGVTYLAYKHPTAYRKVASPLWWLVLLIQIVATIWSLAVQAAYLKVMPFIDMSKWAQAEEATNSIVPRWWLVSLACVGASAYLCFLYYGLPKLLYEEKKESPDEPSPEKKDENI